MRKLRTKSAWGLALSALLPCACLPASSPAAPASPTVGAVIPQVMTLPASRGYTVRILVLPAGPKARPGASASLLLFVTGHDGVVIYTTPAASGPEGSVRADLGRLGAIDVRFRPSGGTRTARSRCGGDPVRYQLGNYAGTIRFAGEEGYTRAAAQTVPGTMQFLLDATCPGASGGSRSGGKGAELAAKRRATREVVAFAAAKRGPTTQTHLAASIDERVGNIRIQRHVAETAPPGAFQYGSDEEPALLDPPPPFSGSAILSPVPTTKQWSGDLSVDFPGNSDVPLTGDSFQPHLERKSFIGSILL